MKRLDKLVVFSILSFFLFLCPYVVYASGSASFGFSGNSSVYVGNNIDVTLYVNESGSSMGIAGVQGSISYDTSKLSLVSVTSLAPYQIQLNGSNLAGMDTTGSKAIKGYSNIIRLTFKANALGTASVNFNTNRQADGDGSAISSNNCSKQIQIVNPPSSNNNLSSLNVSNGSINFNKNNTNYSVNVDSNVTSINISASAEDGGASISGTGAKGLNFGNNRFDIIVTAPSGAKKNYTINVNRKDNRSSNNRLASLSVNGAELNPKFSSGNENYNVSVPYSIANLSINAKAEDSKAKVNISSTALTAEETTDVRITVTAENGSTKTYVIHATRGKDPNKILSTNNYLSNLSVSNGVLSPQFNKDQEKYIVYLPYEVDSINIDGTVEDTRYATIKKEGPDKLSIGNNNYKLIVTAEDGSTKTYTIIVSRGMNMTGDTISSNTYLKSIKIKKGSLNKKFDKNIHNYTYTSGKIEAIPEDENSTVELIQNDNITTVLVKSVTGEVGIYTLTKKGFNITYILGVCCIALTSGGIVLGYNFGKKKAKKIDKVKNKE